MANGEENTIKSKEKKYQNCIHKHPSLIEEGIVELSDALNTDPKYMLKSLGTELNFGSGPIDNLFVDFNAVLTIVECKLYITVP